MGRHRRSVPAAAGTGPAAADEASDRGRHRNRPPRGRIAPGRTVRTGLLGASATVAMGAVALASGLLPGGSTFETGREAGERVRADALPDGEAQAAQGGQSATPVDRSGGDAASRGAQRKQAPHSAPASAAAPSTSPSPRQPSAPARGHDGAEPKAGPGSAKDPAAGRTQSPRPKSPPATGGSKTPKAPSAVASQVLALVNQERAQAGCSPLTADGQLGTLAQNFSEDMARRGFFDHIDPDGASPWDRAKALGIGGLGGENIARGQADARAVMETWMNSPGHRANILNCEYRTLGVGAHFGPGGPWWTQNFGF